MAKPLWSQHTPPTDPEKAGWKPDPAGEYTYRFWDGTQWTKHVSNGGTIEKPPQEPDDDRLSLPWGAVSVLLPVVGLIYGVVQAARGRPRSAAGSFALAVTAAAVFLWFGGALDRPLSSVGLNKEPCAENLFGHTMCGEQLIEFCEDSYDPGINGEVCGPILRDEGYTAQQLDDLASQQDADIEDQIASEEKRLEREARERAQEVRVDTTVGQPATAGNVTYTVTRTYRTRFLDDGYDSVSARRGRAFFVAEIEFVNEGRRPKTIVCGGIEASLGDTDGRQYSPDGDAAVVLAYDQCGDVQPGDYGSTAVAFSIPRQATPLLLTLPNPNGRAPEEGGAWVAVGLVDP